MRTISVYLSDETEEHLAKIMNLNQCTAADAINIALRTLSAETRRVFTPEYTLWQNIKMAVINATGLEIREFCEKYAIHYPALRALCRRIEQGSSVRGFGDSNKWRDKQDGRLYKTHTAYACDMIRKHVGIDLDNL